MQHDVSFHNLSQFPNLFHAISTKADESMKDAGVFNFTNISAFLQKHDISPAKLILMEQIHGDKVTILHELPSENVIKGVDGLVAMRENIFLGVVTADCLPIVLYDPKEKRVGIAHAGYKGLLKGIIQHTLEEFRVLGSDFHQIWVGIGPAIGDCCYEVAADRIELFRKTYPSYTGWYRQEKEKYFLNMKSVAQHILQTEGVLPEHIEISSICTKDRHETFFSYRKEFEKAGRFVTITGLRES